jgi:hypothetical protein
MPILKVCEHCGEGFKARPQAAGRRFCKIACRQAHTIENAAPIPESFTCKQCGNPFMMKASMVLALRKKWGRDPLYCSIGCSALGRKTDAEARANLICIQCGGPITDLRKASGYLRRGRCLCSPECRALFRRLSYQAKHPDQKLTRRMYKNGYYRVIVPGKGGAPSREVFEHRYVMEQEIGRRLLPNETIHHIDGDRGNNTLSNLELRIGRHGPGQRVTDLVRLAIELLARYPEEAKKAGVELEKL